MRIFLIAILCFFHAILAGQNNFVKNQGITSPHHWQNVGNILFSDHKLLDNYSDTDFIKTYTLTNKSNLYFLAYFDNSLTNYLHQLDSTQVRDSLTLHGNYQFTIYIDGQLIYQSNLLPGAPASTVQDTATLINKPLIVNDISYGLWTESFWNRFMNTGGDSVLTEGNHLLRMEIRPYLKLKSLKTGTLIAKGELNLIVARKPFINLQTINLSAPVVYGKLKPSNESFNRERIKLLIGHILENVFKKISSIVVIKNGRLLVEEYFNGANRTTLHDPRSVGKSFASTLTGMAIADGYIKSEHETLEHFYHLKEYKNFSVQKQNTSIRDLLTMSSGFDGNDEDGLSPGNEENMYPTDNWVNFTLNLPSQIDAGKHWQYFTAGVILLGDIINKSVPGGLERYAHKKLFAPLDIINYKWEYTPQTVPNTAGGIQMNALDFAKYGMLYKNKGNWYGKQIIPLSWVARSLSRQITIENRKNEFYGYLFWNRTFRVNQHDYEASYCAGNGGNYILIFKTFPLVVVITATAYGQSYAHSQVNRILTEFLLPAVID